MYVSCAIISTVQSTSANQIDVPASSEDKSKARQSPTPAGVFLFNSFFIYSLWSLFCQCGNIKKQLVKITVIFATELCKMVRHKLISCSFWSWISCTLRQNYAVARCFLWVRHCGAVFFCRVCWLLCSARWRLWEINCWVTALLFLWYLISATRWRSYTVYWTDVVVE